MSKTLLVGLCLGTLTLALGVGSIRADAPAGKAPDLKRPESKRPELKRPDPVRRFLDLEDSARIKELRAQQQASNAALVVLVDRAIVEEVHKEERPVVIPPPPPEPVHLAQVLLPPGVLAAVLFCAWVVSLLLVYYNRKFNPWAPILRLATAANRASSLLDEPSVVDFFRALQTNLGAPTAAAGSAGPMVDAREKKAGGAGPGTPPERIRDFYNATPGHLTALQSLFSKMNSAPDETVRQKKLQELHDQVASLRRQADLPELLPFWQVVFALEGLLGRLSKKAAEVTPSALRTAAGGLDLLVHLCSRRPRPDMVNQPPVRILAVDDDFISRRALSLALEKLFAEPDLAKDGPSALTLTAKHAYDVIFLDVEMPGMDGFELCTKIHQSELNRNTPVVFVTSHSDFASRAKSAQSGGHSLLGKPFLVFEVTLKAISLVLRGRLPQAGADATPAAATAQATPSATPTPSSAPSGPAVDAPSKPVLPPDTDSTRPPVLDQGDLVKGEPRTSSQPSPPMTFEASASTAPGLIADRGRHRRKRGRFRVISQ